MTIDEIIKEKSNKYYQTEAEKFKVEIKKLTNLTLPQGKLSIKDYAMRLGEFVMYYHQRTEADKKIGEILDYFREADKK